MKRKLNYRFHNPNTPEKTADYITKVFIEVNRAKVDMLLQQKIEAEQKNKEEIAHSA